MSSPKCSSSTSESPFHANLKASLVSRESRQIRRRLPVPSDPILTSSSSSFFTTSSYSPPDTPSDNESTFEPTPSPTFFAPTVPSTPTPITSSTPTPTSQHLQPLDFSTNDYLSLSTSSPLRTHFLRTLTHTPHILGSGGSRLLVNPTLHDRFERRLARFYKSEEALLWNSGFDANVGVFGCLPRGWGGGGGGGKGGEGEGDWVVFDEYVHASVWDGMRAWESRNHDRLASSSPSSSSSSSTQRKSHCIPFKHNDMASLRRVLETLIAEEEGVREGRSTVFVAVESLYSMDGTVAPLKVIVGMLEELFGEGSGVGSGLDHINGQKGVGRRRKREAYLIVDEAHATGIYGPQGRGMVAREGLEESPWILARLVTFGKALAASGAVLLTNTVVREYLLNYARSLIYTTALSNANIVAASCSFDMLENGVAGELSAHLLDLCDYFLGLMRKAIKEHDIPAHILCLPEHLVSPVHPSTSASSTSTSTSSTSTSTSTSPSAPHPTIPSAGDPAHQPPPTPIIPLLTPHPRSLAAYLLSHHAITIKPITYPTVPKGKERVRVCLRAGMGRGEVERLVGGVVGWVGEVKAGEEMGNGEKGKERARERARL